MNFFEAKKYILNRLNSDLPKHLSYHGYHHTLDVYEMVIEIAHEEGVTNKDDLIMLKTAALFHDCGFLTSYKGHEDVGCRIAKDMLPEFDYNQTQIEKICGMIQATKIPQSPKNLLEQIIADADLDYLGRDDFYQISKTLLDELKSINALQDENEWNKIQVSFIKNHHYFTQTCINRRKTEKEKRLAELEAIIK
jgi:uncharacterized protein